MHRQLICLLFSSLALLCMPFYIFAQEIEWECTFHAERRQSCALNSITQTEDGGYFAAGGWGGFVEEQHVLANWWMARISEDGDSLWSRRYGRDDRNESAIRVFQTADGGYVLLGSMTSESGRIRDLTILKVDESGDSLWCRTYGEAWDGLFDGIITDDDEYVLLGITTGGRRWRDGYITLIKVDSDGELIFNVDFGCNESDYLARSICDAGDGFIMAGSIGTRIPDQSFDGLVIRTDYNGDTLWIRTYRSPIALIESFKDISPTTDGGFIICGQIETVHDGGRDLPWFVRIDENGEVLWQRYYDWDWQNFYFRLHSIIEYPEGNYLCAGTCTRNLGNNEQRLYNAFLMSIDAEGDSLSSFIVDYRVNPNWCDLHLTQDSSLMAIISPSNSRTTVRKLSFDENSVQRLSGFFPYEFHLFPAYPNPFNTTTILTFNLPHPGAIDLTVFDPLGRQVRKQSQPRWFTNGQHRIVFDGGNMAAGNYMLRLEFGGEVFTQPLILIK